MVAHTQATVPWLSVSAAAVDLRGQAIMLARQATHEHGAAVPMGLVAAACARVALAKGAFGIAQAGLDVVTVPTNTPETMQLAGFLPLRRSCVAAADRRRGDVDAPLEYAAELAARTGEGNAYGLGFGPINVDLYRISGLLEVGDHERVVSIAEGMNPQAHARDDADDEVIAVTAAGSPPMSWYLRSSSDHDTHRGELRPDGTVAARCGAVFVPKPLVTSARSRARIFARPSRSASK